MIKQEILIIEDDKDTLLLLKSYLLQMGYPPRKIIECTTYQSVTQLDRTSIGVVITDLGLPDSIASETFSKVKNLFPSTPVIVITGKPGNGAAFSLLSQGAEDYLEKGKISKDVLERSLRYATIRGNIQNDYRRLFDENPASMYIFEQDSFCFIAVNNAALHQYGYSREEFLSLTADKIRPEEDRHQFFNTLRNNSSEYTDFGAWRHRRKDGSVFFVQVYAHTTIFHGKAARLVMALNIEETVNAKRSLEEKIRENENILRSITDGFFAVDNTDRFTYVNPTFEKLLQVGRNEVIGRKILDVFPDVLNTIFYKKYREAITGKSSVHFDALYETLNVWLSVSIYPSENGVTVFFMDITRQKQLQQAIQFNEQNMRATIDNTEDLIWSVDVSLNIISANNAFQQRMITLTGHMVNSLTKEHFSPKAYDEWISYYQRALSGEAFMVVRSVNYNDKETYEEVRFNPIHNQQGIVVGVSCISRDITEQQQHLRKIENQNEQLKKIAWIQSHELRRPVANILGLIPLVDKQQLSDHNAEIIQHLELSAIQLDEIIHRITVNTNDERMSDEM